MRIMTHSKPIITGCLSLLLLLIMANNVAFAQKTTEPSVSIATPLDQRPRDFEDYLVQLAFRNNPNFTALNAGVAKVDAQIKAAKIDWFNGFSGNVGIAPRDSFIISQIPSLPPGQRVYPGVNYGIGINFGPILTNRAKVKVIQQERIIAEAEVTKKQYELRAAVLTRYRKYQLSIEVLTARLQALETATTNKALITELFNSNKVDFEDLNRAESSYFAALEAKLTAETEVLLAKIDIEEIIGIRWDEVEKYKVNFLPKK